MMLVGPVPVRRWNLARLVVSVRSEDRLLDDYLRRNSDHPEVVIPVARLSEPQPTESRIDLAQLGYAVTRGQLRVDLLRAQQLRRFRVRVVHGAGSRLSRAATAQQAGRA
ncbi:hypothetical protein BH11ACT7_BH11ACT7_04440 [soil metagenome]